VIEDNVDNLYFPVLDDSEGWDVIPFTASIGADLYGVKSAAQCPQCGARNVVVTLGASPDPFNLPCPEFKFFNFFGITKLPDSVVQELKKINPKYTLCTGAVKNESIYQNTCAVCGGVFDDDDLRREPGDAFLPVWAEDYERIELVPLDHQVGYDLTLDEYETRTFDGIEADCCYPAPDLFQVIFEGAELSPMTIRSL
jgi:hypothetical protein